MVNQVKKIDLKKPQKIKKNITNYFNKKVKEEQFKRRKLSPFEQEELNEKLIEAVEKSNIEKVKSLLEAGADVNAKNKYGWTALMDAAAYGYKEIVELLIKNGADVNIKDRDGWTALIIAAYEGHKEIVELLLTNGADPFLTTTYECVGIPAGSRASDVAQTKEIRKLIIEYEIK